MENENYATRKFPLRIEAMCVRILYRILRQYSYNRNMEAMNILYKELVLEGVIPEFEFNMEVWKNDKSGKNVWKWYQEGILDIEWEEPMLIILLMQEYPYFMHYEK